MTDDSSQRTERSIERGDRTAGRHEDDRVAMPNRRTFLKGVGAGAAVGLLGVGGASAAPAGTEFVETDGTDFVLDGDPIYFSGTNNFWITNAYTDRAYVDRTFELFEDMGIDLVRTWTFCEGDDEGHCMQPEAGVHNPAALEHLDYVVAKARQHGIRLTLSFVDFWAHDGGMDTYVEWADAGTAEDDRGEFYVNERCRELYRNHVETIVTRENSITGLEYRNDPTIAMWELANEPRNEPKWTTTDYSRDELADMLHNWFADMSAFVKDLDANHLVTTGMEGFYTEPDDGGFLFGNYSAQDFVRNHKIDTIDVCSLHMYPHWWPGLELEQFAGSETKVTGVEWIKRHVQDAHEAVGKPCYLGEFNTNAQEHSVEVRNDRLSAWFDVMDKYDMNASTLWQIVHEDEEDHDGFQIYDSESGDVIREYNETVQAKSGDGSGTPVADAVAPSSVRIGEAASFDGVYSFDPEGSLSGYEWDFGDGSTGTGQRVTHRFDSTGSYETELSVTDGQSNSATDTETVAVEGIPENSVLVEGAGETVHQDTKEFHFASMPISGDVTVEATVADMTATDPEAQAGIMVADDPESPGALGAVTITPGEGSEITRAFDSTTWRERVRNGRSPPIRMRLERSGKTITGYMSEDGDSWTEIGTGEMRLPEDAHLGLFVSSNSPGDLCTVQFDDVGWLENWESTDVGDVAVAGNATAGDGQSDETPTPSPGEQTVGVDLAVDRITADGTAEASVTLSEAPQGLAGYTVEIGVDDPTVATVDGATYPDAVGMTEPPQIADDGSSVRLKAVDVQDQIQSGAEDVELASVTLSGASAGETTVGVVVEAMDGDDGAAIPATGTTGSLTVASVSEIEGEMPQDHDGDGLYEDLNGNGRLDSDDVVLFFEHKDDAAITDHVGAYDYNDNGRIDFDDVASLFGQL